MKQMEINWKMKLGKKPRHCEQAGCCIEAKRMEKQVCFDVI